jgi:hypothetical protein
VTFLNPLYLLGLAGMAVPLVIHLLSQRSARRVDFSTLEFLRQIEKKSLRRRRVRQLLLLTLRMLLIAAVAIALARPTLTGVAAGGGGGSTALALILDDSFSMAATVGETSLFSEAQRRAGQILATLGEGDEAILVVAGEQGEDAPVAAHSLDAVRDRIAALEPSLAASDLAAAVRRAVRSLERSRRPQREIHVVTDFQASAWAALAAGDSLPASIHLVLVPVGSETPANAWIETIDTSGQILDTGSPLEFRVVVASGPEHEPRPVDVEFEADGVLADRRRIDLGPASRVALTFHRSFGTEGLHVGAVTLRGAEGPAGDDRRPFTLRTEAGVPVLLVCEDERARRYLHSALAPGGDVPGAFHVREGTTADLESVSRENAAVVLLADVERLTEAQLARLKTYLSEGGGLLVLPGPRLDAAAWGRSFLPKLLPGRLVGLETASAEAPAVISRLDPSHPLFELFRGEGGLDEARFTRWVEFRPQAGVSVLAYYSTGEPALVESNLFPGRLLFFTFSLDPRWSDLPLTGVFLPLIHEAVRYVSAGGGSAAGALDVGRGATVWLPTLPAGGGVTLVDPEGRERGVAPTPGPGGYALTLATADRPGIWVFRSAAAETLAAFAAAVPASESDFTRVDPAEIRSRLGANRAVVVSGERMLADELRELRLGREIGRTFLWAAAFLLLAEMIVARRTGHSGTETVSG